MKMTIEVCDLCQTQGNVQNYHIERGNERVAVDLCSAHSNILESLIDAARSGGSGEVSLDIPRSSAPRAGARRRRGIVVTPMSAIEPQR